MHSLAYLVQFWNNYEDTQLAAKLLFRLENRWNEWEQPLLLLSYLLHPEYRIDQFSDSIHYNHWSEQSILVKFWLAEFRLNCG